MRRDLLGRVFKVLDEVTKKTKDIVVAYSGGKDSTTVALLLRDWVEERGRSDVNVLLLNSDTLSEIPEMRSWTKDFMEGYVVELRKLGVSASFRIVTPGPDETFYWRVFVRGYPAPTFNFRWCVYLLKRKPAREVVSDSGSVVLMGHRDEESSARTQVLNSLVSGGFCPLSAGRCSSYYLLMEGNATKVFPIRDWKEADVWDYLRAWDAGRLSLRNLFRLYGDGFIKARYGCWHCTLVKHQLGNLILGEGNLYLEAVRLMYRWVSDSPRMRIAKNTGYSRLGQLNVAARSFLLNAIAVAEKLSQVRLYGLDETGLQGYTLRQVFYELPEHAADEVIATKERMSHGDSKRVYSIRDLRNLRTHKEELSDLIREIEKKAEKQPLIRKHIEEITSSLESL